MKITQEQCYRIQQSKYASLLIYCKITSNLYRKIKISLILSGKKKKQ